MIKIVIADDHTMFRQGLIALLKEEKNINIIGEASNGKELLELLERKLPDLILLDIEMPELDGFDVLRVVKKKYATIKTLVLTMHKSIEFIKNIIKAGADGYLVKDSEKETLIHAIHQVYDQGSFYSEKIASTILNSLRDKTLNDTISAREKEVIQLIVDGNTTKEIAKKLFLSKYTVESHRQNILLKLQLKNTAELVKYAIQKGLV